jgi:hypothetical protein
MKHIAPCENWETFGKEYNLQIMVFKVEIGSFCPKYAYSANLKKHMYLLRENHLC